MLLVTGVLHWDDLAGDREAWNTFVWFACLFTMATFLGQLGLIAWFTDEIRSLFGGVGWTTGFAGLVIVYFYSHYFFASNTAHVSAMYAPFLVVALALGTPPLLAALALGFSSSLFSGLTHYGTGPAPIWATASRNITAVSSTGYGTPVTARPMPPITACTSAVTTMPRATARIA